jgi:hypothetical protein
MTLRGGWLFARGLWRDLIFAQGAGTWGSIAWVSMHNQHHQGAQEKQATMVHFARVGGNWEQRQQFRICITGALLIYSFRNCGVRGADVMESLPRCRSEEGGRNTFSPAVEKNSFPSNEASKRSIWRWKSQSAPVTNRGVPLLGAYRKVRR